MLGVFLYFPPSRLLFLVTYFLKVRRVNQGPTLRRLYSPCLTSPPGVGRAADVRFGHAAQFGKHALASWRYLGVRQNKIGIHSLEHARGCARTSSSSGRLLPGRRLGR